MSRNLIAILRGVRPTEIIDLVTPLLDAGIDYIEVPLNSPDPFDSIAHMVNHFGNRGVFGAGTVLRTEEVQRLADIGAHLVVSPNTNPAVIQATKAAGMLSFPGAMTPTECFTALDAGADGLKFFPAELIGPVGMKAIRAVLPADTSCYAVGGAGPDNFGEWFASGASGFGIGSKLYKPGISAEGISRNAKVIVTAYDQAKAQQT